MTLPRRGGSCLLLADFERLEAWCRDVRRIFVTTPYLVGSAMVRSDYRDVDVRVIFSDRLFDRFWADNLRVRTANHAVATWGQRETGLPIDFQIQRQTEANADFPDQPRNPMGIRDWRQIPTSGTPKPDEPAPWIDPVKNPDD